MATEYLIEDIYGDDDKKKKKSSVGDEFVIEELYPEEPEEEAPVSQTGAALRGLGQSMFALGDEATGLALAAKDYLTEDLDKKQLIERYKKYRDEQRELLKLDRKHYPKTSIGSEIAGSLAMGPVLGAIGKVSKLARAAKKVADNPFAYGFATGVGASEEEDVGNILTHGAMGGATGVIADKVLGAAGKKLLGKTKDEAEREIKNQGILPKVMDTVYDMPREFSEEYLKNPKKFKEAAEVSTGQIASQLEQEGKPVIKDMLIDLSKESTDLLRKGPVKKYKGEALAKMAEDRIKKIESKYEGKVTPDSNADEAIRYLQDKADLFRQFKSMSPERVKKEIIDMDTDQIYSKSLSKQDPTLIKRHRAAEASGLRNDLDQLLKRDNIAYRKKMKEETSEAGKLKGWVDRNLNTFNKIENMLKKAATKEEKLNPTDAKMLEKLSEKTGKDWVGDYKLSHINEQLEKAQTQGSKRVKKWSEIGGNTAALLFGAQGNVPGAAVSIASGRLIGTLIGDAMDKHGKRYAMDALERAYKMSEKLKGIPRDEARKLVSDELNKDIRKGTSRSLSLEILKATFPEGDK